MAEQAALRVREGAGGRKAFPIAPGLIAGGDTPLLVVVLEDTGRQWPDGGLHWLTGTAVAEVRRVPSPHGDPPDLLAAAASLRESGAVAVAVEAAGPAAVRALAPAVDVFRVPPWQMQNFSLLRALGECRTPVLLSRGPAATLEEWLLAAEYVLAGGNDRVVLCETGVLTAGGSVPVPDLATALEAARQSALPVVLDVSYLPHPPLPLVRSALAAGLQGAGLRMCDGAQALLQDPALRIRVQAVC